MVPKWCVPAALALLTACGAPANGERDPGSAASDTTTSAAPAGDTAAETLAQAGPPQPARVRVESSETVVDWEAARRDLASRPREDGSRTFNVQSGSQAPPVPVLLPSGVATVQGADAGGGPTFRPLDDGYFAKYPGPDYDITVSGTNRVYDDGRRDGSEAAPEMRYQSTMTGAQVSLSRYGADYLVEFECKSLPGARGGDCIDEETALEVARNLVIAGSR